MRQFVLGTVCEPKYRLNKKDAQRWHDLLVRHCLEVPDKPGGEVKRRKKYPPLTLEENVEFERLGQKRSRKISAHPKVRAEIEASRRRMRRCQRLLKKMEALGLVKSC